jgi:hypothetical protein
MIHLKYRSLRQYFISPILFEPKGKSKTKKSGASGCPEELPDDI